MKRWTIRLLLLMVIIPFALPTAALTASGSSVYEIPLHEEVEKGLFAFLSRSYEEADRAGADRVIIRMNTPGGFTDAADEIGHLIRNAKQETIVFIEDNALSAGAYIALHADQIYMTPTAKIGAAQVIVSDGTAADDKAHSAWVAAMINAAEQHGRNPLYAEAMANPAIDLPAFRAEEGKLLTLTAKEASSKEVGYSEGIVDDYDALLKALQVKPSDIQTMEPTFAEQLTRLITHPIVVPILLSIAGLGLVLELYSPGFGVPGLMGLSALGLFFFGHLFAGLAGYETLIVFLLGVGLLLAEWFVPGGLLGIAGAIAIGASIMMAGADPMRMTISMFIAVVIAMIGGVILVKFFGKRLHWLNRVVLMDATTTEEGYVSNESRHELVGREGITLTALRPAGVVEVEGERLDVVSDGGYVEKGQRVRVVQVEGVKIVVTTTKEEETT